MHIPKTVLDRLLNVFQQITALKRVYLFGSRARGDHRDHSDIDLAIEGHAVSASDLLRIQEAAALYKADIILLDNCTLDEDFLEEFRKESIVIYER